MLKRVAMAFAILLLAGCASNQIPVASTPPSARTVGIVVSTPQQLRVATTGLTVFENAIDLVDIPDWHLDEVAYAAAAAALSPRYQVSRIMPTGPVVDHDSPLDKLINSQSAIEKQTDKFVDRTARPDLYVIISQSVAANRGGDRPNILISVGVSKTRNLFTTIDPVAHTFLLITILDGRTLKTIATTPLRTTHRPSWSRDETAGEPLAGFAWKDSWGEMSDQQQALIRDRITALLADSVAHTLQKMMAAP